LKSDPTPSSLDLQALELQLEQFMELMELQAETIRLMSTNIGVIIYMLTRVLSLLENRKEEKTDGLDQVMQAIDWSKYPVA